MSLWMFEGPQPTTSAALLHAGLSKGIATRCLFKGHLSTQARLPEMFVVVLLIVAPPRCRPPSFRTLVRFAFQLFFLRTYVSSAQSENVVAVEGRVAGRGACSVGVAPCEGRRQAPETCWLHSRFCAYVGQSFRGGG